MSDADLCRQSSARRRPQTPTLKPKERPMLTLPRIVERTEQPYVAVRRKVTVPFNDEVDRAFSELKGWAEECCQPGRGLDALVPAGSY
jgi:hypothetical protein